MFCAIYRSVRRDQTYLYIGKKDDFSRVPQALMECFGKPLLAMTLMLEREKRLANADNNIVMQALKEQGYYLHLPPVPEALFQVDSESHKIMTSK